VGRQIRALSDGQTDQAGFAADAARQLAEKVEEIAGRLEQRGFDGAVDDLTSFARRRPGMFLVSAAATGFLVGRLGRGAQAAKEIDASTASASGAPRLALMPTSPAIGTPETYLPPASLPSCDGGV